MISQDLIVNIFQFVTLLLEYMTYFQKGWQYFFIIEDNTSMNKLISANKSIKSKPIHSMDIVDNVWHWFTSLFKTIKLKKAIPAQCHTTCKK